MEKKIFLNNFQRILFIPFSEQALRAGKDSPFERVKRKSLSRSAKKMRGRSVVAGTK